MFYIYANGKSIYQPMIGTLTLLNPKLTLEMGKAGSVSFQVPVNNEYYNALNQLSTTITVEMDDEEVLRGRVLTNNRGFNKTRTVYCEGNLAYLVDSVQKGEKFEGKAHTLFRNIIAEHNKRVEARKQFVVGNITVENRDVLLYGKSNNVQDAETGKFDYNQIALNSTVDEWLNSFDYIQTALIDYIGGYLRTRYQNGVTYIDWLADYGTTAVQEIEFGKNLLDLTEEVSAEDVFTVLIPLGDENLTIASVNNGSDELVDAQAVARYGRIVKTHVFDGVNNPATLLENGQRFLTNHTNLPVTITVKAVDMHLVDPNASPIRIGDRVRVTSAPHDMFDYLVCTKIEYDMANPANNTYTFGTPKPSLTERYRKDKKKNKGGGGGAAEVASEEAQKKLDELFDAWINVDPSAGHIDLGTLYEKYKNDKTVLKNQCGIDLDAPSGNINIKNLREAVDENTDEVRKTAARIDLINNDVTTKINLIVARADTFEELESGHYAALTLRVDDVESAIDLKADKVTIDSIQTQLTATKDELTDTKDVLTKTCGISLDASGRNANINITTLKGTVDDQGALISGNSTRINSISSDLSSLIILETQHYNGHDSRIAAVELKAQNNESTITLKADKTYVDGELNVINGKLKADEGDIKQLKSDLAEIDTVIANKVNSILVSSVDIIAGKVKATRVEASGISVPDVPGAIVIGGYPVATRAWVQDQGYATEAWVEQKGYLTSIPSQLRTDYIYANKTLRIGGYDVATQTWCTNTQKFATQEWVLDQLKSYAASGHSHEWADIKDKPTTFKPSSHKHKFTSDTKTVAWGHVHQTYATLGSDTKGVKNYSALSFSVSGTTNSN